jgi:hypothetical protein
MRNTLGILIGIPLIYRFTGLCLRTFALEILLTSKTGRYLLQKFPLLDSDLIDLLSHIFDRDSIFRVFDGPSEFVAALILDLGETIEWPTVSCFQSDEIRWESEDKSIMKMSVESNGIYLSTQVYAFTRHRVRLFNDDTKGNTF